MQRRGFTIVELIIVITIIGVLLTLAVVNVNSTQLNARDNERKSDIEALSLTLENFYTNGNDTTLPGSYPATSISSDATNAEIIATFRSEVDIKTLLAPGAPDETFKSFISATNAVETTSGVTPQPDATHYVYQPLQTNGTLCTVPATECRKFNLYYYLEGDDTVYKYESKNR